MKFSSKTLLRISAIGLLVHVVYSWVIMILMHIYGNHQVKYPILYEAIGQSVVFITLISIALALFVFYKQRKTMPTPDKHFRIMTYVTAGLLLLSLIIGIVDTSILNICYFHVICIPLWMLCIDVTVVFVWLWMLSNRTGEEALAKPVTIITLCSGIMIVLYLVIRVIVSIYVFAHGIDYDFHTFLIIYLWITLLVPVLVIGSYAISIKRASKTYHRENQ